MRIFILAVATSINDICMYGLLNVLLGKKRKYVFFIKLLVQVIICNLN